MILDGLNHSVDYSADCLVVRSRRMNAIGTTFGSGIGTTFKVGGYTNPLHFKAYKDDVFKCLAMWEDIDKGKDFLYLLPPELGIVYYNSSNMYE